ncbi:MAG: HAD family hydrolase [Ignavibacteriae bacterium]|nr:HAD family hydrolase [Ignavibacteriota bacterium]MCB9217338.1 HAD family hydrolase [Ignavibacteria bacterium]
MRKKKGIFLDRDGVVNRRRVGDYVKMWEEFEFLPDIFDVLPKMHEAGYVVILVTNQRGIALQLMTEDDLSAIHEAMQGELARRSGHKFDGIFYCPHDNDSGCDCRKPRGGMILQGAEEFNLELKESWMIGDSETDIEAGIEAKCKTARIAEEGTPTKGMIRGSDLYEVWTSIVGGRGVIQDSKGKIQNGRM